jgi:large subunit ribosomal protein L31e
MGHGQDKRKIQDTPQDKTVAAKKNKSVGGDVMEKENQKEIAKTQEEQEEEPGEAAETAEELEPGQEIEEAEVVPTEEEQPVPAEGEAEKKEEEITAVAKEEEVKPPTVEKKAEEEIVEERVYTVPLGKAWIQPPNKRTSRAVRMLRSFITKHMKLEEVSGEGEAEEEEPKRLIISNEVNEKMWKRGIEKPPRKIRVRAAKDKEGNVTVYLAEGD